MVTGIEEVLIKETQLLDAEFYKEGVKMWGGMGNFDEYIEGYMDARWWIFCHQN